MSLAKSQVASVFVIVRDVVRYEPDEMILAEDHGVLEKLATVRFANDCGTRCDKASCCPVISSGGGVLRRENSV